MYNFTLGDLGISYTEKKSCGLFKHLRSVTQGFDTKCTPHIDGHGKRGLTDKTLGSLKK